MIKGIYTLLLSILLLTFAVEANARFIQPDWWDVSNPQVGTNPYAYSHNNPINLSDRNGNIPYNPGGDTSTGWNDNGDGSEDYCSCTDRGSSDYSGGFALDDQTYSLGRWEDSFGRDDYGSRASIIDGVPGSIYNDDIARSYSMGAVHGMGVNRPTPLQLSLTIGGAALGGNGASMLISKTSGWSWMLANQIATGHAFGKHVVQKQEFAKYGITNVQQFKRHIERIIRKPSSTRDLSDGRSAYWDDATGTVVIRNPKDIDGGTAFIPLNGRAYFEGLN